MIKRIKTKANKLAALITANKIAEIPAGRQMVSFTFDDIPQSAEQNGARILSSRGVHGSFYLSLGMEGKQSPSGLIATRDHIQSLIASGHECGCHTYHHVNCAGLIESKIREECRLNREAFRRISDLTLESFAFPFGGFDRTSKQAIAETYKTARTVEAGINSTKFDPFALKSVALYDKRGSRAPHQWLDALDSQSGWLIFYTHDVDDKPSPYGCSVDCFTQLLDTCLERDYEVVTVAQGQQICRIPV